MASMPGLRSCRGGMGSGVTPGGGAVPVEHLERAVGARRTQVRQLSLLPVDGLAN
jgi:hypothetical protein